MNHLLFEFFLSFEIAHNLAREQAISEEAVVLIFIDMAGWRRAWSARHELALHLLQRCSQHAKLPSSMAVEDLAEDFDGILLGRICH